MREPLVAHPGPQWPPGCPARRFAGITRSFWQAFTRDGACTPSVHTPRLGYGLFSPAVPFARSSAIAQAAGKRSNPVRFVQDLSYEIGPVGPPPSRGGRAPPRRAQTTASLSSRSPAARDAILHGPARHACDAVGRRRWVDHPEVHLAEARGTRPPLRPARRTHRGGANHRRPRRPRDACAHVRASRGEAWRRTRRSSGRC